jgi:amino acid permease
VVLAFSIIGLMIFCIVNAMGELATLFPVQGYFLGYVDSRFRLQFSRPGLLVLSGDLPWLGIMLVVGLLFSLLSCYVVPTLCNTGFQLFIGQWPRKAHGIR